MEYYVYRHIRLDKNEPFYIGTSRNKSGVAMFHRAKSKHGRNPLWYEIIKKTGYEIDILFISDNQQEIYEKEKEFIDIYGRTDRKTGTLSNRSDGGKNSTTGVIKTDEQKLNGRLSHLGRKASDATKLKMSISGKRIENVNRLIARNKTITSESFTEEHRRKISASNKGRIPSDKTRSIWSEQRSKKPVFQFTLSGDFVKEWKGAAEIKRVLGIDESNIQRACTKGSNKIRKRDERTAGGFKWSYKINN